LGLFDLDYLEFGLDVASAGEDGWHQQGDHEQQIVTVTATVEVHLGPRLGGFEHAANVQRRAQ